MKEDAVVVLLAEDNPAHAEIIMRLLHGQQIAHRVVHVSDGEAVMDYLHRRGAFTDPSRYPVPHLLLLDLRLPKIDGLEVLQRIKSCQDLLALPVVVLSSSAAPGDIAAAYRRHANSYLVKPLDYEKFVALIDTLGRYWLTLNCRSWGKGRT